MNNIDKINILSKLSFSFKFTKFTALSLILLNLVKSTNLATKNVPIKLPTIVMVFQILIDQKILVFILKIF